MSGDDSFFAPTANSGQLNIRSRADTPEASSDADPSADATFFGAGAQRHPRSRSLAQTMANLERIRAEVDAREAYLDAQEQRGLTPVTRAQVEAYRQQVREEVRAGADFASSVGESHIDEREYEEYEGGEDDEEEGEGGGEDMEVGDEDESYESEGSSAVFDPDNDPAEFAERLDELAGVMEMGEVETRALRWGPSMNGHYLPVDDFKTLINHHLTSTEWRYENLATPGAMRNHNVSLAVPTGGENHPIRVLGSRAGRFAGGDVDSFSPRYT